MKEKRVLFGICCMVCTMLVSGCGAKKESAELPAVDRTEEVDGTEIYRDILEYRKPLNGPVKRYLKKLTGQKCGQKNTPSLLNISRKWRYLIMRQS